MFCRGRGGFAECQQLHELCQCQQRRDGQQQQRQQQRRRGLRIVCKADRVGFVLKSVHTHKE